MEYLSPVPESVLSNYRFRSPAIGPKDSTTPEIDGLLTRWCEGRHCSVQEDRRAYRNTGCDTAADHIRPFLYQLHQGTWNFKIADMGNIYRGERHVDTVLLLQDFCEKSCAKALSPLLLEGLKT